MPGALDVSLFPYPSLTLTAVLCADTGLAPGCRAWHRCDGEAR